MEFKYNDAKMWFDEDTETIFLEGTFRLNIDQYEGMTKVLNDILSQKPDKLKLDLTSLEFLNSSGINVIAKFVIAVRNGNEVALTVCGNTGIPWQGKSLPNLKKLYPAVDLVMS